MIAKTIKMDTNIVFSKYAHGMIFYKEGEQIGKCLFVRELPYRKNNKKKDRMAIFRCVCGKDFEASIRSVKRGDRVGCRCKSSQPDRSGENNPSYKHNHTPKKGKQSSEYQSWGGAKERCFDPKNSEYHNYGGRGITMYAGWVNDFKAFIDHIGLKPSPEHSLDRWPDKNGNYEPGNVRWATQKQQARNKRNNREISFNGQTKLLVEWADEIGIKGNTISRRIKRGWSLEDALRKDSPKGNQYKNNKSYL